MAENKEEVKTAKEADLSVVNNGQKNNFEPTTAFVFMDKVTKILDISLSTGKNCILHGPGGYGKSEFTYSYFREKGIEPYVITMGSGMTTDRLFGGVDLMKFNETGKIEYLIENSFMNQEFVIFEELFDAPDFILEQLKDILSSGIFRNGSQVFEIKTQNIVCCTNKTREEFSKNLSLRALMERFPLEMEVKWETHNRLTYQKLLEAKFGAGNVDPLTTYILEEYAKKSIKISPRIALVAADVVDKCGPECLEFIADFQTKENILKDAMSKFKSIAVINEKVEKITGIIKDLKLFIANGLGTQIEVDQATQLNKELYNEINALTRIKADDSMAVSTANQAKQFSDHHRSFTKSIALTSAISDTLTDAIG